MRKAMPPHSDATNAAYFLYGLGAGMFSADDVKSWAFAVIEEQKKPPVEIIEIAMSARREVLFESLKAVPGERDIQKAGRWLLSLLRKELQSNPSSLKTVARKAMQVARSTSQPEDVYYLFDGIDDEIFLAENNTYGSLKHCRSDLDAALAQYEEARP
jgi:hypothetical protein